MFDLDFWTARMRLLGLIAIGISLVTWATDISGFVYACPYCRTQRTVIGILGLLMIMPNPGHWISRYLGAVLAVLGLVVGSMQHFNGWKKVMAGTCALSKTWYVDAFILSGFALFIIVAQLLLLYAYKTGAGPRSSRESRIPREPGDGRAVRTH